MSAPAQAEGAPLPNFGTLQVEGTPIEILYGSKRESAFLGRMSASAGYGHSGAQAYVKGNRVEDGRGSLGHATTLRFPSPLIEPDVRISRIRLVRYRRTGMPNAEGHVLDRGHVALDTKAGEISVPLGSS